MKNNVELLQKYQKEENSFKSNFENVEGTLGTSIITPELDALKRYAEENNILMDYTNNSLGRDSEGNIYKAIMQQDGQIKIDKIETTFFTNESPTTQSIQTVEVMAEKDVQNEIIHTDNWYIDYLLERSSLGNGYYSKEYLNILNASSFTQHQIDMYKNMVEMRMIKQKQLGDDEILDSRMQKKEEVPVIINKPKQLIYKNSAASRGGFINAFLLTMVTILFGSLCVAYMFFGILG